MMGLGIEIGDICKVVPHFQDWESVGAVPVGGCDEILWIPKGSFVMVAEVLQNSRDDAGWCHVIYDGKIAEIGADLLEPIHGT